MTQDVFKGAGDTDKSATMDWSQRWGVKGFAGQPDAAVDGLEELREALAG